MTHSRGVCGSASTRCTLPLTTKSNAMLSSSAWANCSAAAGGCTSGRLDREHRGCYVRIQDSRVAAKEGRGFVAVNRTRLVGPRGVLLNYQFHDERKPRGTSSREKMNPRHSVLGTAYAGRCARRNE